MGRALEDNAGRYRERCGLLCWAEASWITGQLIAVDGGGGIDGCCCPLEIQQSVPQRRQQPDEVDGPSALSTFISVICTFSDNAPGAVARKRSRRPSAASIEALDFIGRVSTRCSDPQSSCSSACRRVRPLPGSPGYPAQSSCSDTWQRQARHFFLRRSLS